MEDNEFEEVTIISHTDHGTSVLPQSTAERLMKEIKLEVTQKISQNENVKLGSLQHSTTPTLLDSIQQNVLKLGKSIETAAFIGWTADKRLWVSIGKNLLVSEDAEENHGRLPTHKLVVQERRDPVVCIWNSQTWIFSTWDYVTSYKGKNFTKPYFTS